MTKTNVPGKSYDQMIEEALAKLPLYMGEWTNYHRSDPGITMLENLTAFLALQQEEMGQVSDKVKEELLKMAGLHMRKGRPAKILLLGEVVEGTGIRLSWNQKLYARQICYELDKTDRIETGRITNVYGLWEGERKHFGLLAEEFGIPGGIELWGDKPKSGQELYICIDCLPDVGKNLVLYVEIEEEFPRNPLDGTDRNPFAQVEWSIYTKEGFVTVLAKDDTAGFLFSGGIYMKVPANAERKAENGAYVVRAYLRRAEYDIPPKVKRICGLFTEAVQTDTKGVLLKYPGSMEIEVSHFLLQEDCFFVYVLEEDGYYHPYREETEKHPKETGGSQEGIDSRTYRKKQLSDTKMQLSFSEKQTHRPLEGVAEGIVVSVCSLEMMQYRSLGRVLGYDNQQMKLPPFFSVLEESLTVMLSIEEPGGVRYQFASPGETDMEKFCYQYLEKEHVLQIQSCGAYEGAQLYLADWVLYQGAGGNVLPGNRLEVSRGQKNCLVTSYAIVQSGYETEQTVDAEKRFAQEQNQVAAAVTREDCERIVKKIPGLSIHKTKAVARPESNTISIVIKPNSNRALPGLPCLYRDIVKNYLEERRMLTTRIQVQEPRYVPIDVYGVIYMESQFENGKEQVEDVLRTMLDYTGKQGGFGEVISFHRIYNQLQRLDCVEEIRELSLLPRNPGMVKKTGMDYQLLDDCLCYPGMISIESITRHYDR